MATKNPTTLAPILSCLVAATLWGLLWYPLRLLESLGVSGLWASLLIYLAAIMPLMPAILKRWQGIACNTWFLVLLALSAGWANLGFILAVLEGTVVRVLLLFYLSPIWSVMLGWAFLRERPTVASLSSVIIAITGAVLMLWQFNAPEPLSVSRADILAITAGMAFSVMNITIRKLGDIPMIVKMIPACLGVIILSGVAILSLQPVLPVFTRESVFLIVVTGSIGMLLMTYTAQYGVTHLPVHRSAVIFLFEIVAGALSAMWLANEIITFREWLGGTLVIIAAWMTAQEALGDSSIEPVSRSPL